MRVFGYYQHANPTAPGVWPAPRQIVQPFWQLLVSDFEIDTCSVKV